VHAAAAAQRELLGAYRSRHEVQQRLEEEALQSKLRQQWSVGAGEWRDGGAGEAGWHAWSGWVGGAAAPASPVPGAAQLRQLRQHEQRWEALARLAAASVGEQACACQGSEAGGGAPAGAARLRLADVPWPPLSGQEYLRCLAALEHREQQQRQQGLEARQQRASEDAERRRAARRAYARACLRWHPDKFAARYGALLAEEDRAAVLQRVQQLSQALNEAWGAQQQEWAADGDGPEG
jgi:hypothetical protein